MSQAMERKDTGEEPDNTASHPDTIVQVRTTLWPVFVPGGWKTTATDEFWSRLNNMGLLSPQDYLGAVDAMDAADAGEAFIFVDNRNRFYEQRDGNRPRFAHGVAVAATQFPRRSIQRGSPRLVDVEIASVAPQGRAAVGTLRALFPSRTWLSIYLDYILYTVPSRRQRCKILWLLWQAHRGQRVIFWDEQGEVFSARRGVVRHSGLLTDCLADVPMDVLDPLRGEAPA